MRQVDKLSAVSGEWKNFGFKAGNLGRCIEWGLPVPEGLAISSEACRAILADSFSDRFPAELGLLRKWASTSTQLLAVRSSAVVDPTRSPLLSGVYSTERGVPPIEDDIVEAARRVVRQAEEVQAQYVLSGQETAGGCAVIVQTEVESLLSGVAHTEAHKNKGCVDLWIVEGDLAPLTGGAVAGRRLVVPKSGAALVNEVWGTEEAVRFADRIGFWSVATDLLRMLQVVESRLGQSSVEWTYDGNDTWILQVQPAI